MIQTAYQTHHRHLPQRHHPAGQQHRGLSRGDPQAAQLKPVPHFGGVLPPRFTEWGTSVLLSAFSKVVEVFLWGYITQDVVAMWMPRIRQSLIRGRIPYDHQNDPENKGLTPWALFKKSFIRNADGLNWVNFWEETKREIAAGPGTLGIPTLAFGLARRAYGNRAVELGHGTLTQLSHAFINHLQKAPDGVSAAAQITPEQYKKELKAFLVSRFDYRAEVLSKPLKGVSLEVLGKNTKAPLTVGGLIHEWADRWVEEAFHRPWKTANGWTRFKHWLTGVDPAQARNLAQLNADLETGLFKGYNRQYQQLERRYGLDHIPLLLRDKASEVKTWKSVAEFANHDLYRWKEFALKVFDEKMQGGKLGKGYANPLPELAEALYKKLVTLKTLYAIPATLLTCFYLIHLANWSQSHKHYVANRLLEEPVNHPKAPEAQGNPIPVQTVVPPVANPVTPPIRFPTMPPPRTRFVQAMPRTIMQRHVLLPWIPVPGNIPVSSHRWEAAV